MKSFLHTHKPELQRRNQKDVLNEATPRAAALTIISLEAGMFVIRRPPFLSASKGSGLILMRRVESNPPFYGISSFCLS